MLMIRLICAIIVIENINCSKNVCDKDCIADVMLINKNNLSVAKDSETDHNITVLSSVLDKITYDDWNQVINENTTSDPEILPHYVVPEISSYERGTIQKL